MAGGCDFAGGGASCSFGSRFFFSCLGARGLSSAQNGGTPTVPGGHAARMQVPFRNWVPGGQPCGVFWIAEHMPFLSSVPAGQRQAPPWNCMVLGQQFGGVPTGRLGGHLAPGDFDVSLPALPPGFGAGGFDVSLPALPPDLALHGSRPRRVPKVQSDARKDLYLAAQA
jgi:hypothetical protein